MWLEGCCKAQAPQIVDWDSRLVCCTHPQTFSTDSWRVTASAHGVGSSASTASEQARSSSRSDSSLSKPGAGHGRKDLMRAKTKSLQCTGLLEEYRLTEILGHGSFSIVLACQARDQKLTADRKQGATYAVKLIEKIEARPEDIEQEAQIHMQLSHPNILAVHRIFFEKCFVCMVVDLYKGGSLVKALWNERSSPKPFLGGKIVHVGRQLVQALDYVHAKHIVHRDVKADNFLADRKDLTDKCCRVVLADFGFACECRLGDRLRRQCGTQRYWSPELWDKNYAHKADIWGLGVTMYGLVESSFPFQTEWDVKHKDPVFRRVVSPTLADFIRQLLCKQEGRRLSAQGALAHPWLARPRPQEASDEESDPVEPVSPVGLEVLQTELPDPAVAERRLELVGRLASTRQVKDPRASERKEGCHDLSTISVGTLDSGEVTPPQTLAKMSFTVQDERAEKSRTFEWWPPQRLEKHGLHNLGAAAAASPAAQQSDLGKDGGEGESSSGAVQAQILATMLEEFGVDTACFGKGDAKSLPRLAEEVETGFSQLMLDAAKHKSLVRVVDVVLLRICLVWPGSEERFLIVSADEQPDGRVREDLNRLPGSKKLPHENVRNAAFRTLQELPCMAGAKVEFDFHHTEMFEAEEESPSYPGVRTVYRKEIVSGLLRDGSRAFVRESFFQGDRSKKFFSWLTEEECAAKSVTLTAPAANSEVSSLVPAPLGLKEEALGKFLRANNVDMSMFGKNGANSLQELSEELLTGDSSLTCLPNGCVARIVDVVLLKIVNSNTGNVLIVAKELSFGPERASEVVRCRLPGTKRRPDESHFKTAKRILRRQLSISENQVNFDADAVCIVEEGKDSPSYPGLHTIYRKRIIPAVLDLPKLTPRALSFKDQRKPDAIPEETPTPRLSANLMGKFNSNRSMGPGALFRRFSRNLNRAFSPGRQSTASES